LILSRNLTANRSHFAGLRSRGRLTLVYAARDELHNDAVVLRDVLARRGSTAAKRRKVSRRAVPSARH